MVRAYNRGTKLITGGQRPAAQYDRRPKVKIRKPDRGETPSVLDGLVVKIEKQSAPPEKARKGRWTGKRRQAEQWQRMNGPVETRQS